MFLIHDVTVACPEKGLFDERVGYLWSMAITKSSSPYWDRGDRCRWSSVGVDGVICCWKRMH